MGEGLMGAGMNSRGEYVPTVARDDLFAEIINTRAPESIFFLPSIEQQLRS